MSPAIDYHTTVDKPGLSAGSPRQPESEYGRPETDTLPPLSENELAGIAIKRATQNGGWDGLLVLPLSEIGELRSQIEIITTLLEGRFGISRNEDPTQESGYVGHYEVLGKLNALGIDLGQADISEPNHNIIDTAYRNSLHDNRYGWIRYSPDNPRFRQWLQSNHPQEVVNYMDYLAWQNTITTDREAERDKSADWGLFQRLFEEWWKSPESVAASRAIPDAFEDLGLSPKDSTKGIELLKETRSEIAEKIRDILSSEMPNLVQAIARIKKAEEAIKQDYGVMNVPEAVMKYCTSLQTVTDNDRPQPLTEEQASTVPSSEVAVAYSIKLGAYLREQRTNTTTGRTALQLVA